MQKDKVKKNQFIQEWITFDFDNLELMQAQLSVLSRQMPLMYIILSISSWVLVYTHYHVAPIWLTIYPLLVVTAVMVLRSLDWLGLDVKRCDHTAAKKRLLSVIWLSVALSVAFTLWAILVFQYGSGEERAHVSFYMAITVISCIFCLGAIPIAALIVSAVVNGTFFLFFLFFQDSSFFHATALNAALVSVGMLFVMRKSYQNFAAMVEEQSRSRQLIATNEQLANCDSLTGLANRRAFYVQLERECLNACLGKTSIATGSIDLDGFKPVNDIYGHMAGDALLQIVGKRLERFASENPQFSFFRIGGDEFSFIILDIICEQECQRFGDKIFQILSMPYDVQGTEVTISATIGIALFDAGEDSLQDVMEKADFALYKGKREGRGVCTVFTELLNSQLRRESILQHAMKHADLYFEIEPVFQPIVDIKTNRLVAFESLARWNSPFLDNVSPAEFIPIAENAGLIEDITSVMIEKTLQAVKGWPQEVGVSINLSALDVSNDSLLLWFYNRIRKLEIAPDRINIEITETAICGDDQHIMQNLQMFRNLGCGIALDDFGVGHSSLSRLHQMPLTKIKIDRSFVAGLQRGMRNYKIVRSLFALSRDMELGCVVEGVETEQELVLLKELGIRLVQGYYYSKPLPNSELEAFRQNLTVEIPSANSRIA